MRRLTYENSRGESVVFDTFPFFISSLTGVIESDSNTQTLKSPYQDGATYIDTLLEPRYPVLQGAIVEKFAIDEHRRRITRVCNPKLGTGKLTLEINGVIRIIGAAVDGIPAFPDRGEDPYQRFMISWICPDPYWRSMTVTEEPAFEPRFRFPIHGPFIMGIQRDQRIIHNDGDAPAPIKVEFFGPALNPKIINKTTGEFIRIKQELHEGERMLIDTSDSSVYFVAPDGSQRNVFPWIDPDMKFFNLQIGLNEIEYTADSDIQGTVVNISYSKLYTAV